MTSVQNPKGIVYIRLHQRLDEVLEEFSRNTGMKRATACAWILTRFWRNLSAQKQLCDITSEDLHFTELEETYFLSIGRNADGSAVGRGMRVTMDSGIIRNLDLLAELTGVRVTNLRCGILAQYFHEIGLL